MRPGKKDRRKELKEREEMDVDGGYISVY